VPSPVSYDEFSYRVDALPAHLAHQNSSSRSPAPVGPVLLRTVQQIALVISRTSASQRAMELAQQHGVCCRYCRRVLMLIGNRLYRYQLRESYSSRL
jgi:hypothetical protein